MDESNRLFELCGSGGYASAASLGHEDWLAPSLIIPQSAHTGIHVYHIPLRLCSCGLYAAKQRWKEKGSPLRWRTYTPTNRRRANAPRTLFLCRRRVRAVAHAGTCGLLANKRSAHCPTIQRTSALPRLGSRPWC
jgi:hypothetical protein